MVEFYSFNAELIQAISGAIRGMVIPRAGIRLEDPIDETSVSVYSLEIPEPIPEASAGGPRF